MKCNPSLFTHPPIYSYKHQCFSYCKSEWKWIEDTQEKDKNTDRYLSYLNTHTSIHPNTQRNEHKYTDGRTEGRSLLRQRAAQGCVSAVPCLESSRGRGFRTLTQLCRHGFEDQEQQMCGICCMEEEEDGEKYKVEEEEQKE